MKDEILELKRQIVHALGIIMIFVVIFFGKWIASLLCILIILASALSAKKFYNLSKGFHRPSEMAFGGAITFCIGILIAILALPQTPAIAGISVLAISDSISTLVGKFYGKIKLWINKKKTLEGSLGFLVSSFIILLFFTNISEAFLIALIASFVEMLPLDDNITLPIIVGLSVSLI